MHLAALAVRLEFTDHPGSKLQKSTPSVVAVSLFLSSFGREGKCSPFGRARNDTDLSLAKKAW